VFVQGQETGWASPVRDEATRPVDCSEAIRTVMGKKCPIRIHAVYRVHQCGSTISLRSPKSHHSCLAQPRHLQRCLLVDRPHLYQHHRYSQEGLRRAAPFSQMNPTDCRSLIAAPDQAPSYPQALTGILDRPRSAFRTSYFRLVQRLQSTDDSIKNRRTSDWNEHESSRALLSRHDCPAGRAFLARNQLIR